MNTPNPPTRVGTPDADGAFAAPPSPREVSPEGPRSGARPSLPPIVLGCQRLAVGSLLGLIVLSLAWELWLAPIRPGGSWLALKALPLCIPLAGLLRNRLYTFRWVSLVIWLYFIEGVVRAWGDPAPSAWLAGLEIALCLALFGACSIYVRLRLAAARRLATAIE